MSLVSLAGHGGELSETTQVYSLGEQYRPRLLLLLGVISNDLGGDEIKLPSPVSQECIMLFK